MVCTKNKGIMHIDRYMRAIKIKLCRQNKKYKEIMHCIYMRADPKVSE